MGSNEGVSDEGFMGWMRKMKSRVSRGYEPCACSCRQWVAGGNCINRFIKGLAIWLLSFKPEWQGPLDISTKWVNDSLVSVTQWIKFLIESSNSVKYTMNV